MFGAVPKTSASAASHVYQTSTQASEASHVHHAAKRPRIGAKRRIASLKICTNLQILYLETCDFDFKFNYYNT